MAMAVNAIKLTLNGNGHLITDHPDKFIAISIATSGMLGMFGNVLDIPKFMGSKNVLGDISGSLMPLWGQVNKAVAGGRYLIGQGSVGDADKALGLNPLFNIVGVGTLTRKMLAEKIDHEMYNRDKPSSLYIGESKPQPKEKE